MGTSEHTAGPWEAHSCDVTPSEGDDGRRFVDIIAGSNLHSLPDDRYVSGRIVLGNAFAHVFGGVERDATARLMAASPDLLEAAKRALNFIENTEAEHGITLDSGDALRAAIARATNQAHG